MRVLVEARVRLKRGTAAALIVAGLFALASSAAGAGRFGVSSRTPTSTLDSVAKTHAAYHTSVAQTQAAIATRVALSPPPTIDVTAFLASLAAPPTPDFSIFVHRRTDAGVIIWQGTSELFYLCYKEDTQNLPDLVNEWRQTDGPRYPNLTAYAGAIRSGSSQGVVYVAEELVTDPCRPDTYLTPFRDGPIEIVDAQGHRLLVRSEGGRYLYFDVDVRRFQTASPTPTSTITPTPSGGPRPLSHLVDYTLFAVERVSLGAWARVEGGNIGVNAGPNGSKAVEADLGLGANVSTVMTLSADSIKSAARVSFPKIMFFNDLLTQPQAPFAGLRVSPVPLPLLTLPPVPAFAIPPDAPDQTLQAPGAGGLPWAGAVIDELTVERGATLVIGGLNEVRRLILEPFSRLECAGDCELRIAEELRVGPGAYLGTSDVLPPAEGFVIYIARQAGTAFHSSPGSQVRALIYAPDAKILLGPQGVFEGAFVARSIEVMPFAVVRWAGGFAGP